MNTTHGSGDLYLAILHGIIGVETDKLTMIDLCCGEMAISSRMNFKESVHVDVIDEPRRPRQFNFVQCSALSHNPVFEKPYHVAYCGDGIEHFTKSEGKALIQRMEIIANLKIIFTPLGEYMVGNDLENPHSHKSGWTPDDFPGWHSLVYPQWHPTLGIGAFFVWKRS